MPRGAAGGDSQLERGAVISWTVGLTILTVAAVIVLALAAIGLFD